MSVYIFTSILSRLNFENSNIRETLTCSICNLLDSPSSPLVAGVAAMQEPSLGSPSLGHKGEEEEEPGPPGHGEQEEEHTGGAAATGGAVARLLRSPPPNWGGDKKGI